MEHTTEYINKLLTSDTALKYYSETLKIKQNIHIFTEARTYASLFIHVHSKFDDSIEDDIVWQVDKQVRFNDEAESEWVELYIRKKIKEAQKDYLCHFVGEYVNFVYNALPNIFDVTIDNDTKYSISKELT